MKQQSKRLLALLLCAGMLFGMAGVAAGGTGTAAAAPLAAQEGAVTQANSLDDALTLLGQSSDTKATASVTGAHGDEHKYCDGTCGQLPVVVLPGINHSPSFLYDESGEIARTKDGARIGGTLFVFDEDNIIKTVLKNLLWPLIKMLVTQRDLGFSKAVNKTVKELFALQATNAEGGTVRDIRVMDFNYPISEMNDEKFNTNWVYSMAPMQKHAQKVGEDHIYWFTFGLLEDPIANADKLDKYIEMVKRQTGHSEVNLLAMSLGGTMLTAYTHVYGWKNVNHAVSVVGVLDGTDLMADFYDRNWNLADEFLYHQYFANIIDEESDTKTLGYLINLLVRILPRHVLENTLTAAMDGILDTLLVGCPQFWAMVPSDRYEALADHYALGDTLRKKTDAFQDARLALRDNILDAPNQGARVDLVSGANLSFGDELYRYFSIVGSAKESNSDGIIQLSSSALGATGAACGETLGDNYVQQNHKEFDYVSKDNTIDVSTGVIPANTWIFQGQHHEAGRNDVVLNLVSALYTDPTLTDVHAQPEVWPQFNSYMMSKTLRRNLLPKVENVKKEDVTAEQWDALQAAAAEGQAVLNLTICDPVRCETATRELKVALADVGEESYPEETGKFLLFLEKAMEKVSLAVLIFYGARGYVDWLPWR